MKDTVLSCNIIHVTCSVFVYDTVLSCKIIHVTCNVFVYDTVLSCNIIHVTYSVFVYNRAYTNLVESRNGVFSTVSQVSDRSEYRGSL